MPKADSAALGLVEEPGIEVDPWPWGVMVSPVVSASKCCKICWHMCSKTKIQELRVDIIESSSFSGEEYGRKNQGHAC